MLLDYSTAAQLHTSWTVQLDWQKVDMNDHNGNASLSELLRKLALAEQEDVDEEDHPLWIRPRVRKKKALKNGLSMVHVFMCSWMSSTIQVTTSPLSDFVDSAQASLAGVIGGYPLKMRKRD